MVDGIVNSAVGVQQHDVAVPAHDFHNQPFFFQVPDFIDPLKGKREDAFETWCGHARQTGPQQVFTQQHAKHRRAAGIFPVFVSQVQAGRGRVGGEQKALVAARAAQDQQDVVPVWLVDAIDPGVLQDCIQFISQTAGRNTIKWHGYLRFSAGPVCAGLPDLVASKRRRMSAVRFVCLCCLLLYHDGQVRPVTAGGIEVVVMMVYNHCMGTFPQTREDCLRETVQRGLPDKPAGYADRGGKLIGKEL